MMTTSHHVSRLPGQPSARTLGKPFSGSGRLRLVATVLAGLAFATPGANAARAESLIDLGKAGLTRCVENLGSSKGVKAALVGDGWRFEGTEGTVRFFSKNGRRVLVVHGIYRPQQLACGVMVRKMTPPQAVAFAEEMMASATSVKKAKPVEPDSVAEWTGVIGTKTYRFVASREGSIGINHGAAVLVIEE